MLFLEEKEESIVGGEKSHNIRDIHDNPAFARRKQTLKIFHRGKNEYMYM